MKKFLPLLSPQRFSALAYLCVCVNAAVLKYYELTDKPTFSRLAAEDALIENLTAVLSFSASLLFFITGRMERKALRRWIYVLGGTVLLFIAGEEISWGQRIFGYPTPDWIAERNFQQEFNLHNSIGFHANLYVGFRYGFQLLCMMACMAFFTGRERIRGIPVPSMLLTLGLLAILAYDDDHINPGFIHVALSVLSRPHNTLICFIIIFALSCRQYKLLIFSAATILLALALVVVNRLEILLLPTTNSRAEVLEYLITLGIFCYSFQIFLSQRASSKQIISFGDQGRASIGPFFGRLARPVRSSLSRVLDPHPPTGEFGRPFWLAIPALSISMSIGLMSSAYVDFWARETAARNLDREIASREPIIRSRFNVYISQNRIIYYIERCSRPEIQRHFFLSVIPTDLHEFPIFRRFTFFEYGAALYRNPSYRDRDGMRMKSSCFLVQPLPGWEIAGIGTGHQSGWSGALTLAYWHAPDGGERADRFERDADRSTTRAYRRMYDAVVSREPRVRSDFDIHLHDRTLTFVKEPCLRSDVEAVFFLHVEPVDDASLPSHRQGHRFDNLDFRFSNFGRVFDDKCMAFVPLPEYSMSRIITGQFTSEKRLWEVEFPFHNK